MVLEVQRLYCDKCKKEIRHGGYVKFKDRDYHSECAVEEIHAFIANNMKAYICPFNPFSPNKNLEALLDNGSKLQVVVPKDSIRDLLDTCETGGLKTNADIVKTVLSYVKYNDELETMIKAGQFKIATYDELYVMVELSNLRIVRRVGYKETEENLGAQIWLTPSSGAITTVFAGANTNYGTPTGSSHLLSKYIAGENSLYDIVVDAIYDVITSTDEYSYCDTLPDLSDTKHKAVAMDAPPIGTPINSAPNDPRNGYTFDMFKGSL